MLIPSAIAVLGMVILLITLPATNKPPATTILAALLFPVVLYSAHMVLKQFAPGADEMLLPLTGTLMAIGLIILWRIEPDKLEWLPLIGVEPGDPGIVEITGMGWKQFLSGVLGMAGLLAFATLPLIYDTLRRYSWLLGILALLGLAATAVAGTDVGNGAKLGIGPLQPTEYAKILLALFAAGYLADTRISSERPRRSDWFGKVAYHLQLAYLGPVMIAWVAALGLIFIQKDLGAALLLYMVLLVRLYISTGRGVFVVGGLVAFVIGVCGLTLLARSEMSTFINRVAIWLDPWPLASGDGVGQVGRQMVESLYALSSGGVLGTGVGLGHPYIVPAIHNDFVMAAVGEELGWAGAMAVLLLLSMIVARGLHIARLAATPYDQKVAAGLCTAIGLQTLIIVGGVSKLIPLTGLTLPFVSYGSNSLIVAMIMIGLMLQSSTRVAKAVA